MLELKSIFVRKGTEILSVGDTVTSNDKHPVDPGVTMEVLSIHKWGHKTMVIYGMTDAGTKLGPFKPDDLIWDIE